MTDEASVRAFHKAGNAQGPLLGIYHFNARAIHALAPRGGIILDLGSGSGRFLAYLAHRRPDLRLIGLDLSPEMVALGNEMLRAEGLSDRAELREGDMTTFANALSPSPDLVSSIFSLHHLPTDANLRACANEMGKIVRATAGAAIWVFDHARPRREDTAVRFPEVFTPATSTAFKIDSSNSLRASWSFDELREALRAGVDATMQCALARILPLYQIHWYRGTRTPGDAALWRAAVDLPAQAAADSRDLAKLLKPVPGW